MMGMFDSVFMNCPYCGSKVEGQTKVGDCVLAAYTVDDAPPEVAAAMEGGHRCDSCGESFFVRVRVSIEVLKQLPVEEEPDDD